MTDTLTAFRSVLTSSSAVTSLVPAVRIYQPWHPGNATFPLITFSEVDNYTSDMDYFDNKPSSEMSEIEIHIFTPPNTSTFAIRSAVDTALINAFYNRDFSQDIQDPGGYGHRVCRYSKRTTLTI